MTTLEELGIDDASLSDAKLQLQSTRLEPVRQCLQSVRPRDHGHLHDLLHPQRGALNRLESREFAIPA